VCVCVLVGDRIVIWRGLLHLCPVVFKWMWNLVSHMKGKTTPECLRIGT
jgi:hypothetical protein